MVKLEENSALVVIDVQKVWSEPIFGKRNNPNAETKRAMFGMTRSAYAAYTNEVVIPTPLQLRLLPQSMLEEF